MRAYQSIETDGTFVSGQQFLLDNIILNSRYGYYVLTALELGEDKPPLIVNRGWIQKSASAPVIDVITQPRIRMRTRGWNFIPFIRYFPSPCSWSGGNDGNSGRRPPFRAQRPQRRPRSQPQSPGHQ